MTKREHRMTKREHRMTKREHRMTREKIFNRNKFNRNNK